MASRAASAAGIRSAIRGLLLVGLLLAPALAAAQPEVPDAATPRPAGKKAGKRKPAVAPAPSEASPSAGSASASPASPAAGKVDAKALVQSGVKLLKQKDYLGALAVFRDAYSRFPSVKLLLNIGTTLKLLGRNAEAANAYQRYLDDPEADPARRAEVSDVLATLDRVLGRIQLAAIGTPSGDTEVQVNDGDWLALSAAGVMRVDPGAYKVAARREGYAPLEVSGSIGAGESAAVELHLVVVPAPAPAPPKARSALDEDDAAELSVRRASGGPRRSRLGLMVRGHFHLSPAGAAALVGPTIDLTDRIEVNAGALLGRFRGGYLGSSFAVLPGRLRPLAAAGVLVVIDDGARFAARGAVGLELVVGRQLSVFVELGGEHLFNPPMTVFANAFVPSAGVFGRL